MAQHRNESAAAAAQAELYAALLSDALQDVTYQAARAGLSAGASVGWQGLSLSLSGYDQRLPELAALVADSLRTFDVAPLAFERRHRDPARTGGARGGLVARVRFCDFDFAIHAGNRADARHGKRPRVWNARERSSFFAPVRSLRRDTREQRHLGTQLVVRPTRTATPAPHRTQLALAERSGRA